MTMRDPDDGNETRRLEVSDFDSDSPRPDAAAVQLPASTGARESAAAPGREGYSVESQPAFAATSARPSAAPTLQPATGTREETVLYVPLAVTVGDGFKFGCGFFMALVLAMLLGFVLLAALFALSSVMDISFPVGR